VSRTPTPDRQQPDKPPVLPYGLTVDRVARTTRQERDEFLAAMQTQGACRDYDAEIWFPLSGRAHADQAAEAVGVCRACPIAAMCLSYALVTATDVGVWGGVTEGDRRPWIRAVIARRQEIAAQEAAKAAKKAAAAAVGGEVVA
jgi:WhiB family redox-sensing transcriptional regulator